MTPTLVLWAMPLSRFVTDPSVLTAHGQYQSLRKGHSGLY